MFSICNVAQFIQLHWYCISCGIYLYIDRPYDDFVRQNYKLLYTPKIPINIPDFIIGKLFELTIKFNVI